VRADDPAAAPIRVLIVASDAEAKALLEAVRSPSAAAALEADRRPRPPSLAPGAAPAPTKAARSGGDDDLDADATALLMYTSGTTGVPKGVMLTHANLVANAMSISAEHQLGRQDRVLGVLPLYHINAFVVTMLAPLAHQGSVAMAAKFSAQQFWQQAIALGCTWLNVVPTIVSYLIEGPAPAREALASIRFCRSASAPLAPEHHRAFEARFGIGIVETMGLTETAAPSFSNPLEPAHRKVGSVGRASGGDARVVGADLSPVADGTTGEIVIRGPHVMRGYYKNEAATRDAFTADGWLRTGDLGHRDSDGFFFVTGRLKELIIKGGENIAPREIDEALLRHPAVLEAAATGIPDPHYGQEILACVVLRPGHGASEDELRAHCVETVGRYKAPKRIRFVDALPRGPSGKVQRLRLRDEGPAD
jgi:long-chain acyl-CoA synthetase